MGTTALRFGIGLLIVIACVLAFSLAQGIGEQLGGGFHEWLVR
jgi:hypothetical protein